MDWKKVIDFAVDFQKQTEELQEMELRDEAARRAFDIVTKEEIRKRREEREAEQQWKRDMLNEAQISNKQLAEMNQLMADKLSQTNATLDFMLNALGCNFQRLERTQIMLDENVRQVLSYVSQRDSKGLKEFVEAHGADAIQIVLSCLALYSK